jgi:hypothetical protein
MECLARMFVALDERGFANSPAAEQHEKIGVL